MDDTGEDSKYPSYGLNQGYGSSQSQHSKMSVHNVPYVQSQQLVGKYVDEDEDEVEEDEEEEEEQEQEETNAGENEINGSVQQHADDEDEHEGNDNQFDDVNMEDDDDDDGGEDHSGRNDSVNNLQRHPKKRKLKSLLSSYEFAPRVPSPAVAAPASAPKPSFGGRNTFTDWSEHETFVLLEAWGDRFLQCGRKSLRSEEWQEVAERVSQDSKIERTDSQCRNRLDTLKKKYKKEKANLEGGRAVNSKWVYFKKMDMLLSSNPQQGGLLRGVDSGENVSMNPTSVNLNSANGMDEMRDSAGNSDSQDGDDDDSDLLPPKKSKSKTGRSGGVSFRLLADSINKFSEIYEKIENSKIQQMIELEKMRMDFHRDLEVQKRQILDKAQAEITKVRQGGCEENDVSAENVSG